MLINLIRVLIIGIIFTFAFSSCDRAPQIVGGDTETPMMAETLTIAGGPPGGSFTPFATAIRDIAMTGTPPVSMMLVESAGSVDNTRQVGDNSNYIGVAFASEAYVGYNGSELFPDESPKTNLRVVTLLYSAYAQMIVPADSDVQEFSDLVGKTVATGKVGSGSEKALERLATTAGIFDQITPLRVGPADSAQAVLDGKADIFHQLVSIPNNAVTQLVTGTEVRLIDMDAPAKASGFYDKYPYYQSGTVPEGSYEGKVNSVNTLLMPTLLIAHKDVPADAIYNILTALYSPEGRAALIDATGGAAAGMTIENAPKAFVIPLHDGAAKFWTEKMVEIPETAMPIN